MLDPLVLITVLSMLQKEVGVPSNRRWHCVFGWWGPLWHSQRQPLPSLKVWQSKLVFIAGFSAGSAGHTMSWCSLSHEWQFLTGFCVSACSVKERIFQGCWVWAPFKARGACSSFHRDSKPGMNAMSHLYNFALLFYCIACISLCDNLKQVWLKLKYFAKHPFSLKRVLLSPLDRHSKPLLRILWVNEELVEG